jgi:hypothetical protein
LDIALKHKNKACKEWRWSRFAPQTIKVLSANKRWEMLSAPMFLDPTEKPERKLPSTVAYSILLKASLTMIKRKGEKISLSQTMGATEESGRSVVHQNRKVHCKKKMLSKYAISHQNCTSLVNIIRIPN